jgi:hypothetical protein
MKQKIETCYFDPDLVLSTEYPEIIQAEPSDGEPIRYIRVDTVKEREAALIGACHSLWGDDSFSNPACRITIAYLYEEAGFEELK